MQGVIVIAAQSGPEQKVLERVFAKHPMNNDGLVVFGYFKIDSHTTGAVSVENFAISIDLAERGICRRVLKTFEILRGYLEFAQNLQLLQSGQLRDFGGTDFVKYNLEHNVVASLQTLWAQMEFCLSAHHVGIHVDRHDDITGECQAFHDFRDVSGHGFGAHGFERTDGGSDHHGPWAMG